MAWQVQALVPVGVLLAVNNADGHLPGHGPIGAEVAREVAERVETVHRALIDPPPVP